MLHLCSHYEQILRSMCRYKLLCTYILLGKYSVILFHLPLHDAKKHLYLSSQDNRAIFSFSNRGKQCKELFTNVLKRLRERKGEDAITQRLVTAGNRCGL